MVATSLLRHEALLYASADEFVDRLAPFVRDGVDAGEPVLVLLPPDHLELLQSALGRVADGVFYADMTRVGHNPARIIPAWHDFVTTRVSHAPARRHRRTVVRRTLRRRARRVSFARGVAQRRVRERTPLDHVPL